MFQHFEDASDSAAIAGRIAALRAGFDKAGMDGFIVPRADEHQGEYVAPSSERLRFISGFTGSAGAAIIMRERAVLLVDGRYTLQAQAQADPAIFEIGDLVATPPAKWLERNAGGLTVGFDPWLHTAAEFERLQAAASAGRFTLLPLSSNPVDAVWQERPAAPRGRIVSHPEQLAGEAAADKLARVEKSLDALGADAALLCDPSAIAWVFNLRGRDIAHVPVALGFAIIRRGKPSRLYWPASRLEAGLRDRLSPMVELRNRAALGADLLGLARDGATLLLDPAQTPQALMQPLREEGARIVTARDPVILMRAQKNNVEIEGARLAQQRDGAAMVEFLRWLDGRKPGKADEIEIVRKLETTRRVVARRHGMTLEDISFDTISGSGPNGAIVHYRVTEATNRRLQAGELLLVDSGGQYVDGTTDITRTVPIGTPGELERRAFTLVLKGMIAISRVRFPAGTRGVDLDVLARRALWEAGFDYAHGTGHGVGSFLSVHEGPQSISKRGMEPLLAGMILSNEPGFYRTGAFGIRIENLILVTPAAAPPGGERAMHGFETLTLCPIDRRLIDTDLLERAELQWLDDYHARVFDELSGMVASSAKAWLKRMTAPLPRHRRRK
jgi:Xaa-Pro aminopeptidase